MTNKPTVMTTLLQRDKLPLSITEKIGDETHSIYLPNNKLPNRLHNLIQADYASFTIRSTEVWTSISLR